jgi:hypothetical protein
VRCGITEPEQVEQVHSRRSRPRTATWRCWSPTPTSPRTSCSCG